MSFLPYPPASTTAAIEVFRQDVGLTHEVVHGSDTATVLTEGGEIPTINKLLKDLNDRIGSGTGADITLRPDLAATDSNILVGGLPAGVISKHLNGWVTPSLFGAVADGVTNTLSSLRACFAASKFVFIPDGKYFLGDYQYTGDMLDLTALGSGITVVTGSNVEFICNTTGVGAEPNFFRLSSGNSHFRCGHIKFFDRGYNPNVQSQGAVGFFLYNPSGGNWGDINISSIYSKNLVSSITVTGAEISAVNRIRGINVGQIFSDDCYYGVNCQNQGDGFNIDNLIAYKNWRPYFVFGVSGHKVKILNRANRLATGAINICRQVGGLPTKSIEIDYAARDQDQSINHVLINHIDLLGGDISNIRVNLDIESSVSYTPVKFVNYSASGGTESSAASTNTVTDIFISGTCKGLVNPVNVNASYLNKGKLSFNRGNGLVLDQTALDSFCLNTSSRNQPVSWQATITNPALGDGLLVQNYDVIDGMCTCSLYLVVGSTTTFGSGDWMFSLPFVSKTNAVGSVLITKTGSSFYTGTCLVLDGSSSVKLFCGNNVVAVNAAVPFAWVSGDIINCTVTFPISG